MDRYGNGTDRQIGHERLELGVGLGRVGLAESLVQLGKVDATIAGGYPQPLGHNLPIGVGRSGCVHRIQGSR
jgi:hypothetical protein